MELICFGISIGREYSTINVYLKIFNVSIFFLLGARYTFQAFIRPFKAVFAMDKKWFFSFLNYP